LIDIGIQKKDYYNLFIQNTNGSLEYHNRSLLE